MLHHDPHRGVPPFPLHPTPIVGVPPPSPASLLADPRSGASLPRGGEGAIRPAPSPVGALPCPARPPVSHAPAVRLPGRRAGAEGSRKRRGEGSARLRSAPLPSPPSPWRSAAPAGQRGRRVSAAPPPPPRKPPNPSQRRGKGGEQGLPPCWRGGMGQIPFSQPLCLCCGLGGSEVTLGLWQQRSPWARGHPGLAELCGVGDKDHPGVGRPHGVGDRGCPGAGGCCGVGNRGHSEAGEWRSPWAWGTSWHGGQRSP